MIQIFLIAIGLAMDAFAVSLACGLNFKKPNWKLALRIGLFFGIFQGGMTLLGFLLGGQFANIITKIDHWIAFILLSYIGIKIFLEGFNEEKKHDDFSNKKLTYLSVATSIDALAVGVSMALVEKGDVLISSVIIAIVAYLFSFVGVAIGSYIGSKYSKYANFFGGIILFSMGMQILIEGLF